MLNDMFHYLSKLLITLFLLVPINLDHQWLCNIRLNFLPTSKFLDCVYASNIQSIYIVSKPRYAAFLENSQGDNFRFFIRSMGRVDTYNEGCAFLKLMKFCSISYFTLFWIETKIPFCICTIKYLPICVLYFRGKSITSFQLKRSTGVLCNKTKHLHTSSTSSFMLNQYWNFSFCYSLKPIFSL